jgi:hypothetical protein
MKLLLVNLLLLTGCQTYKTMSITGYQNVFIKRVATVMECPNSSGQAIDIYLDKDGSGDYSSGDKFEESMYSCNGLAADYVIQKYNMVNTMSCFEVITGKLWANKLSSNSSMIRLYNGVGCSGSIVNSLSEGTDEVFFNEVPNIFVFLEGKNSDNNLMLIVLEL